MAVKTLLSSSKSGHIIMHQVTKTERCRNEATKLEATPGGDSEQKNPVRVTLTLFTILWYKSVLHEMLVLVHQRH